MGIAYNSSSHFVTSMSYNAYLVMDHGMPRDHHAIFIETEPDTASGYVYQVSGNIQEGMFFNHKAAGKPEDSGSFMSKELLGTISHADYARAESVCNSVEAPKKQFDVRTRLYPQEPLRRCQEWTVDAIAALKTAGVLKA